MFLHAWIELLPPGEPKAALFALTIVVELGSFNISLDGDVKDMLVPLKSDEDPPP